MTTLPPSEPSLPPSEPPQPQPVRPQSPPPAEGAAPSAATPAQLAWAQGFTPGRNPARGPASPGTAAAAAIPPGWGPLPRKSLGRRFLSFLFVSVFTLSLVANVSMLFMVIAASSGGLHTTVLEKGQSEQTIAVFAVEGAIDGKTTADFRRFFRQIKGDTDVKAVVLRVNSPGGTVSDSDEIHHLVSRIRTECKLPVIVSMGGMAASGGYYISAGANQIFAEPTTVTGSIGVIGSWPVVKDLLNQHGVQVVMVRSRQAQGTKATENPFEHPSPRTLADMESLLSSMHEKFEQVVRDGRGDKLKTKLVPAPMAAASATTEGSEGKRTEMQTEPLNGRVYLAKDAVAVGLVDEIGYLNDAVKAAATLAKLKNPRIVQYTRPQGLLSAFSANAEAAEPLDPVKLLDDLSTPRIMMMWKME